MTSSSSPALGPLSYDDKEIIRLSLQGRNLKIYAVASVSLYFRDNTQNGVTVTLLGALVLFRTGIRLALQLFDISTTTARIKWRHDLTKGATIVETEQNGEGRAYTLSDAEHQIKCVFADGDEASKFISKFLRTVNRIETNGITDQLERNLSQLHLDEPDDRTIRGISISTDSRYVPSLGERRVDFGNANLLEEERKCHDEAREHQNISKDDPDQQGHDPNFWECMVNGRTYRIPDLTAKLAQLPLRDVKPSTTKLKGGFGIVRRTQLVDGTDVAVKTLFRDSDNYVGFKEVNTSNLLGGSWISKGMKERKRFKNEAAMQSALKHSNILPLLGIAESEARGLGASLILPWMKNLDSRTYLKDPKNARVRRLPLILGTIRGLAYLHSQGIVHGDIKARNILISDTGEPLLSDFGLTSFADIEDRELSTSLAGAGNPMWSSPELLRAPKPGEAVTKYSDMWAFAMTVIELLTGDYPFQGRLAYTIVWNYELDHFPARPQSEECPDKLWELVLKCWAQESSSRPAAEAARRTIEVILAESSSN